MNGQPPKSGAPRGPHLEMKQGLAQTLVMTPQLRQAIELLQMNNLELEGHLRAEVEANPFLELIRDGQDAHTSTQSSSEQNSQSTAGSGSNVTESAAPSRQSSSGMSDPVGTRVRRQTTTDSEFSWENVLSDTPSLYDYLYDQIGLTFHDPRARAIAMRMVEGLDPRGYFIGNLDDIATELGVEHRRIEDVLITLQSLEPAGIFARDLSECLLIQLAERDRLTPAMRTLLENQDLLASHKLEKLAKKCDVDLKTLRVMIAELRTLDPHPGHKFDTQTSPLRIPDVIVHKNPSHHSDMWRVELNPETLPRLLVNREYVALLSSDSGVDKPTQTYMTERVNAANWLVKALDQRAVTIIKVASEILKQQEAFFHYGIEFLKPMTLRDVAEAIEMHESTVSRVTSHKYIQTPRGLFELKFFFSAKLGASDGGMTHSAQSVKARIKSLIEDEDPKKVLSDDKLAQVLKDEGVDIARRTVAKYREGLGIPTSSIRKRMKKMG